MNDAVLSNFRQIADEMSKAKYGEVPHDWQWIGKYSSQRMFGIPEARAKEYAARFGGEASKMS